MKARAVVSVISFLLTLPSWGRAAEELGDKTISGTLKEVVVTATRTEQPIQRVPASVTVIDEEDIQNSNAKSVVDLLRSQQGIVVRDLLGHGKTAQVDLRGFGEAASSNTLVLIDGRRINAIDLSGIDWTQIPLEQIERIEILRGTGTVLYGDNAVGGVINIITKTPSRQLTVSAGGTTGSYSRNKEQLSGAAGTETVAFSVNASYDSTEGYRENGELRAKDVGGKIIYDPMDFLSFTLSGAFHSDDYGLPGDLSEAEMEIDRRATTEPYNGAETRDGYLKLGSNLDLGEWGSLVLDLSYRDRRNESRFVSFTFESDSRLRTWSITPRYIRKGDLLNHSNTLIAGVDFYRSDNKVKSFFGTPLSPSGLTDIEKETYGLYFNDELSLLRNLVLSVGARYEQVQYRLGQKDLTGVLAPLDDTVTEHESALSAGLSFLYGAKSAVFVRVNQSFRFPLTDELVVYDYFKGQIRVNSELKPQRGRHYEVGIRHYFTPKIQGNLTLFRAEIKDEIFFNSITYVNTNHPETLRQGVEIGVRADIFRILTLYGNYTYQKAKFETDPFKGNDVPAVPRHEGNMGLQIHNLAPNFIFSADCNWVGSSYAVSDQDNHFGKLDQYYTVDMRLSYEWRWLKAFVGVNNLTDKEYSQYAAIGGFPLEPKFYPAPERNWVAGLQGTF